MGLVRDSAELRFQFVLCEECTLSVVVEYMGDPTGSELVRDRLRNGHDVIVVGCDGETQVATGGARSAAWCKWWERRGAVRGRG